MPPQKPTRKKSTASKRKIKNLDQLAELAGVSKSTVSRAMANSPLISDETRKRVQELAKSHSFSVNRNARRLTGRTNIIAIALDFPALEGNRLSDPFHFELLADLVRALAVRDMEVLLCSPKMDEERGYEDLISARGADGIIFVGQGSREEYLLQLAKKDVPFVVWGAVADSLPYCAVGSDNFKGGKLAGQRLATLKRKTVLFVGASNSVEFDLRRQGLEEGLSQAHRTKVIPIQATDLSYESTVLALESWLESNDVRPDGLFAASDTTAMAACAVLQKHGYSIPEDISVIGYDDIPFATYLKPSLTTIKQNTGQGGALLVEKLMQRLEGMAPTSSRLPTELIIRES